MKMKKILLVENHPATQAKQIRLLQNFGYRVDIAPSSLMALQMFDNDYDLIILGKRPPDLSYQAFTKIIRQQRHQSKTTILSASAFNHTLKKTLTQTQPGE